MAHFSEEQLAEIGVAFGLTRIASDSLPVRDGRVRGLDFVWWRHIDGPERVVAEEHWENIRNHPELYQLNKPETKITYLDA